MIATNCVKNATLYPAFEKVRYVSEQTRREWFRSHPCPGDLIFVLKGSPGQICLTPDPVDFCIAQDMVALRADISKVYPEYLFAVLRSNEMQNAILNMHVGSLIPHFKKGDFRQLRIPVVGRDDQKFIGDIYVNLSKKIDLNRRMNETLEAMAWAIFKDWFIDLGPTCTKVEGRAPYLAPDLWGLFPDQLDDDGKPEGWSDIPFAETVEIIGGGTPRTSEPAFWDGDIPWFSVVDAPAGQSIWVLDTAKHITVAGVANCSTRILPIGTIILSARGTVGKIALVGTPMAMNQSCYGLRDLHDPTGSFGFFSTHSIVETLRQRAHGSVFDTITRDTLSAISVMLPAPKAIRAYSDHAAPLLSRVRQNLQENATLSAIRDLLLPKLMSGELRVRDAERVVEATL